MKKTHLIILSLTGVLSFVGAFGTGFILKRNKAVAATPPQTADEHGEKAAAEHGRETTAESIPNLPSHMTENFSGDTTMSENQLKSLICDLQEKMEDVKDKQNDLEQETERITITRQTLANEIEQLNQLRESINQTLLTLQDKERTIRDSVTEIEAVEKTNLMKIAAFYDKMDPAQSSKILTTMASNNQIKDAVKILYYMTERNASKLLGEIGATRPETASTLSLLLKQIKEKPAITEN